MLKTLCAAAGLSLTLGAGAAFAQSCPNPNNLPYPLCDGSTAYGSQVLADVATRAPAANPAFSGYVGIGTTSPITTLDVQNATSMVARFKGNAGSATNYVRVDSQYGAGYFGTYGNYPAILYDGVNPAYYYDTNNNQSVLRGAVYVNGASLTVGSGGPGTLHLYGSTVYDTGNWLHFGAGNTTADGDMTVNGSLYLGGIRSHNGQYNAAFGANLINFWWDQTCLYVYVDVTPFPVTCPSDRRVKTNVGAMASASGLNIIRKLRPVTFSWSNPNAIMKGMQYGLVAQEVQAVAPDLVQNTGMKTADTPDGMLRVDYTALVPILIQAVKEQEAKIEVLEAQVAALKGR